MCKKKRIKLVSEPNYHTAKQFSKNLLAVEMNKTKVKMNKSVYLGMSILDISKTFMYEFSYDYDKPKHKDKAKLCYMDTDSFVIHIFIEDFFEDNTMMLKGGLIHLTMIRMTKDHFQWIWIKKQSVCGMN